MRLPRRRKPKAIDDGLALCLAGQVSVGLARNAEPATPADVVSWTQEMEESASRARAALTAIALMLGNATDDPDVHETLALPVTIAHEGGATILRSVPPEAPSSSA